jgi:protein-S-isoprenylcysteine O-methyltransferase Ste14
MRISRAHPPVYFFAALALMVTLHRVVPVWQVVPATWRRAGWLPILAGLIMACWAAGLFRLRKTTLRPGVASSRLVTDGPFRFTRNPMYLGMALALAGVAGHLGSLSPWLVLPAFVGAIDRFVVPVEEAMLRESFGEEYGRYLANVRRWI